VALALLAALPLAAAITPSVTLVSNINCGSVITSTSAGTLVMATTPVPSGARSVTGGTTLGGSPTFFLGALTLTGTKNDAYTIENGGGATATLTGPSGKTQTVAFSSVVFSSGLTGTFPASGTTPTIYFGLTVNVQTTANSATGAYTSSNTFSLKVKDTTGNKTSPAVVFTISTKVDPTPISLAKVADLGFGAVFAGASTGTVVVTPAGARSSTGGATLGAFLPGTAGSFTVTGALSAMYVITLPSSVTLSATGGGTMTVDTFTSTPSATGTLNSSGSQALAVGATVHVGASQAQGNYSGTFNVTVAYD